VIVEEGLVSNAQLMGDHLTQRLRALQADHAIIGDLRGLGLMVGVEFVDSHGKPNSEAAKQIQKYCLDQKLLLLTCGSYENVIRWIPPLIVTSEEIDEAADIFAEALASIS
jgi:4-aminobutyrate aminotransferase